MSVTSTQPPCLLNAWAENENQLLHWLLSQVHDRDQAADILHDVFLQTLSQGHAFCEIQAPRAWLYQVARHCLVNYYRKNHRYLALNPDFDVEDHVTNPSEPVDDLTQCLPRVLNEMAPEDRDIIRCCDIEGMALQAYATANHLTLPATKSRIQRARKRLRNLMVVNCQVVLDEQGSVCCFTPRTSTE